jgi:transcription initiation factor IIE alpha subunit
MTICNAHDQEVCYESPQCPACEIQIELDEANEEIAKLEKEVEELYQATDL